MANEQRLSDFTTPHINGLAAKRVLANEMLYGIAQGEICGANRGITEKFSNDTSAAQIRVLRVKPLSQAARSLGSTINGANMQTTMEEPESVEYGIDLLCTLDKPIVIAEHAVDMLPVDILGTEMKNWNNLLNRNINAFTLAFQIKSVFDDATGNVTTYTSGTDKLIDKVIAANALLDDGDPENDIDVFPTESRIIQLQASKRPALFNSTTGVLSIGGSNYAQQILAKGSISPDAKPAKIENGYIGDIDGVPCHIVASTLYRLAEAYLGLPAHELDTILAVISSDYANARAVAINKEVKIVDAIYGQGVVLQPKVRWGGKAFYSKGNSLVVSSAYANPITKGQTLSSTFASSLVPVGSRQSVTASWTSKTPTVTLGTGSTSILSKNCVIAAADRPTPLTLVNLVGVTKAKAFADTTSGTAVTFTTSGTYYFYQLDILADGTVSIVESALVTNA